MRGVFITGTDTGVGKTLVTGFLARYFLKQGHSAITQKWVQTGSPPGISSDIAQHLRLMKVDKIQVKDYLELLCPYSFRFPASPHLASRMAGKIINRHKIISSFKLLSRRFDTVLVEGAGGVLVPLDHKGLIIDLAKTLRLPVIVVAQNKLGAINHTLLTIQALRLKKMKILGVVFNNAKNEDKRILADNPGIVKKLSKVEILGVLGFRRDPDQRYKSFLPALDLIYKRIIHG